MTRADEELIIDNSPIPFVIVGPSKRGRSVYVRSNDKNLDLVGLDAIPVHKERKGGALFWSFKSDHDEAHLVRSKLKFDFDHRDLDDDRYSDFVFVWRGSCQDSDIARIESLFRLVSLDISMSADHQDRVGIAQSIAPLITICRDADVRFRRRITARRNFLLMSLGIYAIVIATLLFSTSGIISDTFRSAIYR